MKIKYLFYYFLYNFIELIIFLYVHTISQNLSSHDLFFIETCFSDHDMFFLKKQYIQ
jgi:hypothetical protein